MKRLLFVFVMLALFPILVEAQTPATPTDRLAWDQPGLTGGAADLPGLTWDVRVDGVVTNADVSPAACAMSGAARATCIIPIPAMTSGPTPHSITVTAKRLVGTSVLSSSPSLPLQVLMTAVPVTPESVRLLPPA